MQYRKEIDGLRALAVIPVILFHAGFSLFNGGYVGVDIFFVISGYLITSVILNDLKKDKFSLINFYERRARRILPALFFVMLFCIPIAYFYLLPDEMVKFGRSLIAVSLFGSNFLFWQESGYFDLASELKPLLHTWSLAIEEQFYIFFPILFVLLWKYFRSKVFISLLVIFFLSFFFMIIGGIIKPNNMFFFYMLPARGWEILSGALIAYYMDSNQLFVKNKYNQICSGVGFALIVISILTFDKQTPFPSTFTILPVLGTALLILCANKHTFVYRFLSLNIIVKIGLISYSAYLWHQPILAFAKFRFHEQLSSFHLLLLCTISFFLAFISWKYIESPFRDKKRISTKNIFQLSGFSILFFVACGFYIKSDNGLISRFSEKDAQVLSYFVDSKNYVVTNFGKTKMNNFDQLSSTNNILIIGDSYAEDLVNAIYESDLNNNISISTIYIPTKCGNIFVNSKKIIQIIENNCSNPLENKKIVSLIKNADEIWLTASWKKWALEHIDESIKNISNLSDAKIKVFGSKSFGEVRSTQYFLNNNTDEITRIKSLTKSHTYIVETMANTSYYPAEYIDVSQLLCNSYTSCSNSTDSGLPISYDGGHLTKAGAIYYGQLLNQILDIN